MVYLVIKAVIIFRHHSPLSQTCEKQFREKGAQTISYIASFSRHSNRGRIKWFNFYAYEGKRDFCQVKTNSLDISDVLFLYSSHEGRIARSTYGLGFLVSGGEFLSLILETAQLDLELVETAGQLSHGQAGVVQLICKEHILLYRVIHRHMF